MGWFSNTKKELLNKMTLHQLKELASRKDIVVGGGLFGGIPSKEDYIAELHNKLSSKAVREFLYIKKELKRPKSNVKNIIKVIKRWSFKGNSHNICKNSLLQYLKNNLTTKNITTEKGPFGLRADIIVNKKIAIELKYAPNKIEYHRLEGQLQDYIGEGCKLAVGVICKPKSNYDEYHKRREKYKGKKWHSKKIQIIWKL